MALKLSLPQRFLLLTTPLVASLSVAASPSLAATFAFSRASVTSTDFSHIPFSPSVAVQTYTFASTPTETITDSTGSESSVIVDSEGSSAFAQALADATFLTESNPLAVNEAISQAGGNGATYIGQARSEARVVGDFFINSTEDSTFSFNFAADLFLTTSIDSNREQSTASANVSFLLLGSNALNPSSYSILDFFSISGELNTLGDETGNVGFSPFSLNKSSNFNVDINQFQPEATFGAQLQQEEASWFLQGTYQRTFDSSTYLRLIEVKRTEVTVKAPEHSSTLAIFLLGGLMGVLGYANRKNGIKNCPSHLAQKNG